MLEQFTDPYECKVYCKDCNAYLHSVSIYEPISQGKTCVGIKCPHPEQCEDELLEAQLRSVKIPFYH